MEFKRYCRSSNLILDALFCLNIYSNTKNLGRICAYVFCVLYLAYHINFLIILPKVSQ